jgi:hypothetical protein
MAEPSVEFHTALIALLDNAVSCDVWDAVPPNAQYPYVTVDTMDSTNTDFLALQRFEIRFVYLNIWSQVQGQAEVMQIISELDTLHEKRLTLSGGYVVSIRVDRKRTMRDADNLTFQGQVTLRVLIRYEEE